MLLAGLQLRYLMIDFPTTTEDVMTLTGNVITLRIQSNQKIEFESNSGDRLIIYQDGSIKIIGDLVYSLQYIITTCWELFVKEKNQELQK